MQTVTVNEAVKLTNKSRSTIQRYLRQGKLRRHTDGGIDLLELERVFGKRKRIDLNLTPNLLQNDTNLLDALIQQNEFLLQQLKFNQKRLEQAEHREDELVNLLKMSHEALRLHQPQAAELTVLKERFLRLFKST